MTLTYLIDARQTYKPAQGRKSVHRDQSRLPRASSKRGEVGISAAGSSLVRLVASQLDEPKLWSVGGRHYVSSLDQSNDELSELELFDFPNWDTLGAEPISKDTVQAARRLRDRFPLNWPAPDIAPGSDGTIGFEWRVGDDIACVDVGPSDKVTGHIRWGNKLEELPESTVTAADVLIRLVKRFLS